MGGVTSVKHISGGNVVAFSDYSRSLDGYTLSRTNGFGQTSYGFDSLGELTSAQPPSIYGASESFTYDGIGNRTTDVYGTYTYDSKFQRLTEDGRNKYLYDNNGNLIMKTSKLVNEVTAYSYSSENQLLAIRTSETVTSPVTKEVLFVYDAIGRRIQKRVIDHAAESDSSRTYTRRYLYDQTEMVYELSGSNSVLAKYTNSGVSTDDVIAVDISSDGVQAGLAKQAGAYYLLKDSIGTVTDVADGNGSIKQTYLYSAFGRLLKVVDGAGSDISSSPNLRLPFGFTGREYDSESGLYFYRARYFSPEIGRFLQQDPDPGVIENPNTINNRYSYAGNNPLDRRDPSGMSWFGESEWIDDVVIGLAVVAIIVVTGGTAAGAFAAVGASALGAAVFAAVFASFQDGDYWENFSNNFHTNFRIAAGFLAAGALASYFFGGGVLEAGAGDLYLNGWVASNKSLDIFGWQVGGRGLTLGSASFLRGEYHSYAVGLLTHESGHAIHFILTAVWSGLFTQMTGRGDAGTPWIAYGVTGAAMAPWDFNWWGGY
jgi:RHS repeat-associated protein